MLPILLVSQTEEELQAHVTELSVKIAVPAYNIFHIYPEKNTITIAQIREISVDTSYSHGAIRMFVVHHFDTAKGEAQNAMLKTLEERNETNQFILSVSNVHGVLPTIRSRCKTIIINEKSQNITDLAYTVFDGLTEKSLNYFSNSTFEKITKEQAVQFYDSSLIYFRNELIKHPQRFNRMATLAIIKDAMHKKNLILSNNINPQLSVDSYVISAQKTLLTGNNRA